MRDGAQGAGAGGLATGCTAPPAATTGGVGSAAAAWSTSTGSRATTWSRWPASTSTSRPASRWRCSDRPARASPPCCRCWPGCSRRPPAGSWSGDRDMTKASAVELADDAGHNVGVVLQGTEPQPAAVPVGGAERAVRPARCVRRTGAASARAARGAVAGRTVRSRPDAAAPAQLTPGERQRLALAVALANRPGLLLADEPTSQLDSRARDEVVAALESVRQAGTTVVLVTHDPAVGDADGADRHDPRRPGRRRGPPGRGLRGGRAGTARSTFHPMFCEAFPPGTLVEVCWRATVRPGWCRRGSTLHASSRSRRSSQSRRSRRSRRTDRWPVRTKPLLSAEHKQPTVADLWGTGS